VLLDGAMTARFPEITPRLVDVTIRRLPFVGDYVRAPRARFEYHRDERDQKFLELAIALGATHVLSSDKDLLDLPQAQNEAGKRFRQRLPHTQILEAGEFMREYAASLGIE
jgi:predicted nucleic acid-binding protein